MSETKPALLRIKPRPAAGRGALRRLDAIVETLDGNPIGGVTRITLRAGIINDVWRATIECLVHVDGGLVADVADVTDSAEMESRRYALATEAVQQVPVGMLVRALMHRLIRRRPKTGADHLPAPMPAEPSLAASAASAAPDDPEPVFPDNWLIHEGRLPSDAPAGEASRQ